MFDLSPMVAVIILVMLRGLLHGAI
jgi:uncharacterized protein YggT (Ycf19 family)